MPIDVSILERGRRDLELTFRALGEATSRRAQSAAIRRTATTARKNLDQLVRRTINIPSRVSKSRIFVSRKPTNARPESAVRISGKLISLKVFKPKQFKAGVAAKLWQSEGRQTFNVSFIAKNPKETPLTRQQQLNNKQFGRIAGRMPIYRLFGPSAADAAMKDPAALNKEISSIADVHEKNLLSQIDRVLATSRGPRRQLDFLGAVRGRR